MKNALIAAALTVLTATQAFASLLCESAGKTRIAEKLNASTDLNPDETQPRASGIYEFVLEKWLLLQCELEDAARFCPVL